MTDIGTPKGKLDFDEQNTAALPESNESQSDKNPLQEFIYRAGGDEQMAPKDIAWVPEVKEECDLTTSPPASGQTVHQMETNRAAYDYTPPLFDSDLVTTQPDEVKTGSPCPKVSNGEPIDASITPYQKWLKDNYKDIVRDVHRSSGHLNKPLKSTQQLQMPKLRPIGAEKNKTWERLASERAAREEKLGQEVRTFVAEIIKDQKEKWRG